MGTNGWILANNLQITAGQTSPEDALSDAKYPVSGSFVDVRGAERFHVVVHLGALADALTFTVQAADAVNGTPADVTGTEKIMTATDDDEFIVWTVETGTIGSSNTHVTLDVAGNSGTNQADIVFYVDKPSKPVTHITTVNAVAV